MALTPHEYQELAADMLYESDGVCAVIPMGGGKTLATLMAIKALFADGHADRAIIWAPKRVAQLVWTEENEKWGLGLDIVTLAGLSPPKRLAALAKAPQIVVINYDIAKWAEEAGLSATPTTVVAFDEVSRMGEATGRQRKSVVKICAEAGFRWGLTGTPKGRDTLKMWGIADIVRPNVWGAQFRRWRAQYHIAIDDNGHQWKVLQGCEELIDEAFADLSFRVTVPVYSKQIDLFDKIVLEPKADKLYREMEKEMIIELDGRDIMAEQSASQRMKLRQISAGFIYDEERTPHEIHRAKAKALLEIARDSGDNLLVMYQFLPEVALIREVFGYHVPILGGETTEKQALQNIADWNAGKLPILLGHEASMGHGLNLQTGGHRLVWYSLGDSYENYLQTNARLARQGQTEQVYAHHLVIANSVEEKMARAHVRKEGAEETLKAMIKEIRG